MWGCLSHREHKEVCAAEGKFLFLIVCCTWEAVAWWFHSCDRLDRAGRPIGELPHSEKEGTDRETGTLLDLFNFESQFNTTPWKIFKHTKSSLNFLCSLLTCSSSRVRGLFMLCAVTGDGTPAEEDPLEQVSFVPGICFRFYTFWQHLWKGLMMSFASFWGGWNGEGRSMCVGDALSDIRTPPGWDLPLSCMWLLWSPPPQRHTWWT